MSFSHNSNVITITENFQEEFTEIFQTIKLGYPQEMFVDSSTGNYSRLHLQNQILKNQINELQNLVLQYEFTNKQALETLRENIMLRDKAMTLEIKVGLLTETSNLQTLEIKKRDHNISSLRKDISEHNKRIELISEQYEENGFPVCKICFRNPPIMTICKNHCEEDQEVGCIFCALRKCPICRNKDIERSFLQKGSKKIRKPSKQRTQKNKREGKLGKGSKKGKKIQVD
jgi:rubrerythrin